MANLVTFLNIPPQIHNLPPHRRHEQVSDLSLGPVIPACDDEELGDVGGGWSAKDLGGDEGCVGKGVEEFFEFAWGGMTKLAQL